MHVHKLYVLVIGEGCGKILKEMCTIMCFDYCFTSLHLQVQLSLHALHGHEWLLPVSQLVRQPGLVPSRENRRRNCESVWEDGGGGAVATTTVMQGRIFVLGRGRGVAGEGQFPLSPWMLSP